MKIYKAYVYANSQEYFFSSKKKREKFFRDWYNDEKQCCGVDLSFKDWFKHEFEVEYITVGVDPTY